MYQTVNNNRVAINSQNNILEIRKHLNLQTPESYSQYVNTLAGLEKIYYTIENNTKNQIKKTVFKRIFTKTSLKQDALNRYLTNLYVSNYNKYFGKNLNTSNVKVPTSTVIIKAK